MRDVEHPSRAIVEIRSAVALQTAKTAWMKTSPTLRLLAFILVVMCITPLSTAQYRPHPYLPPAHHQPPAHHYQPPYHLNPDRRTPEPAPTPPLQRHSEPGVKRSTPDASLDDVQGFTLADVEQSPNGARKRESTVNPVDQARFATLNTSSQRSANSDDDVRSGHTIVELYLSFGVLVFALIIIGLQSAVMLRSSRGWGPQSTRVFGITLTVTMGAFLITAGYSQDQIAPMMGILGTLLGYLLGQTKPELEPTNRTPASPRQNP